MAPRGNRRLVMVVSRRHHDLTYKPPPHFCLRLACQKGGGAYLRDSTVVQLHNPFGLCNSTTDLFSENSYVIKVKIESARDRESVCVGGG